LVTGGVAGSEDVIDFEDELDEESVDESRPPHAAIGRRTTNKTARRDFMV
jgi:hypothetical protein